MCWTALRIMPARSTVQYSGRCTIKMGSGRSSTGFTQSPADSSARKCANHVYARQPRRSARTRPSSAFQWYAGSGLLVIWRGSRHARAITFGFP